MKFMVTFTIPSDKAKRDEAIARFKKTGGHPPQGATLLGRWTQLDMSTVYVLVESDDPKSLAGYAIDWSDLLVVETAPVMEDTELSDVLKRVGK
jgi:hypothetical protein